MTLRYDVQIGRLPVLAIFNARGAPLALERAIKAAGLPWQPRMQWVEAGASGQEVLRLGPRNVLVLAPLAQEKNVTDRLERAFASEPDADFALVTDMYAGFSITGPGAESVLRQGAPLDLSDAAFPAGRAAGTELWAASAIILRRDGLDAIFHVMIEASYAGYLEDWLAVASGAPSKLRPGTMSNPPPSLRPA